jgi:membrane protease YdiL (CAAX protease family)
MWKMHLTVVVKAAQEEVIWRSALFAIGSFLGISGGYLVAVVTVLFYAVHIHLDRKIVLVTQLELLTFSFVLSLAYAEVGSLIGTLLIHVIRNSYIKFARPEEELHQSEANLPALTHGSSGYTCSGEIEVAISATEKKE